MENNKSSSSAGIGFTGALQIVFIVLKLCKVINWSWWAVLIPTWIGIGIFLLVIIIYLVTWLIVYAKNK